MPVGTKDAKGWVKAAGGGKKMQRGVGNLMGAGAKLRKGDYGEGGKQAIKGTRALANTKLGKRARRGVARTSKAVRKLNRGTGAKSKVNLEPKQRRKYYG